MHRYLRLVVLLSLINVCIAQQPGSIVQDAPGLAASRITLATQWLDDFCVIPPGSFPRLPASALNDAFDKWRTAQKVTPCPATPKASEPDAKGPDFSKMKLIPSTGDRLLRMAEFQADGQQTPAYVYGIRENALNGTASTFLPNLDHGIFSYGGPVHFDELFIPSDARIALCLALGADKQTILSKDQTTAADPPAKNWAASAIDRAHCNDEDYIATGRVRDRFARIGSSVTLNIRYSQVPLFQSGILISPLDNNLQKWSGTVTGSFDPSKLFRSAAELQALSTYVGSDKAFRRSSNTSNHFDIHEICGKGKDSFTPENTSDCVSDFAMGSKLQRTMLFFLPIIAVKVTSPFDLAKYGTTFQEPPNHSGRSLYDVTLMWNLHSTIPSAQNLTAGVKMVQAVYQAEHPKTEVLPADAEWRRQVKLLYMELKTLPEIANNEAFWELFRNTLMHNSPDAKAGASTP